MDHRARARPLIGVTGPDRGPGIAWQFTRLAVRLAGGRPVHLTPSRPHPPAPLDAVIIGGGDDIDPALYAGTDDGRAPRDPRRDAFEGAMIADALRAGRPLLGICRGAQLLNVITGGNLHQDLRPVRRLTSNRRTPFARKSVAVDPGSLLAAVTGRRRLRVNSLHHQAVRDTGEGLRIVARDRDEIVQAIEGAGPQFVVGVQWHPEYLPLRPAQRRLFAALVRAARERTRGAAGDPSGD